MRSATGVSSVSSGDAVTVVAEPAARVSYALATRWPRVGHAQMVLCGQHREPRIAHQNGRAQRVGFGRHAGDQPGGRRLELQSGLFELRLGHGGAFAGSERCVELLLHLQRRIKTRGYRRHIGDGADPLDFRPSPAAVEHLDVQRETMAVAPRISFTNP